MCQHHNLSFIVPYFDLLFLFHTQHHSVTLHLLSIIFIWAIKCPVRCVQTHKATSLLVFSVSRWMRLFLIPWTIKWRFILKSSVIIVFTWLIFMLRSISCVHCLHLSPEILLAISIPSSPFSFRCLFRFEEILSVCQRII